MLRAMVSPLKPAATRAAQTGRALWGLFFLAASAINLLVTLPNPGFYRDFAGLTFFPFYRWLLLTIAVPNAVLISALVVVFELAAGLLILWRGRAVAWGLAATAGWVVFLCPSMGWYTLFSPLLLVIPAWLLRYSYPSSFVSLFRHDRTDA